VLIVLADQLGRSVGDMYAGAMIPGLVLTGLYMGYVLWCRSSWPKPGCPPCRPRRGRWAWRHLAAGGAGRAMASATARMSGCTRRKGANADILGAAVGIGRHLYLGRCRQGAGDQPAVADLAQQVIIVLIPPLALIFLVLGTIFLGIATPTEGGAMGAVGAMVLAAMKGG
jgi:TRAP-type mannitol/chloroaromatic compound transport system permease large subunit